MPGCSFRRSEGSGPYNLSRSKVGIDKTRGGWEERRGASPWEGWRCGARSLGWEAGGGSL